MSHSEQFEWVAFYREFAETLLQYKKNRHELVEKIKGIYSTTGLHMPMLEKDNQLVDDRVRGGVPRGRGADEGRHDHAPDVRAGRL